MTVHQQVDPLSELLAPYAARIERDIDRWLVENDTPAELAAAMRYSVLGGGKCLRPALVHLSAQAVGGAEGQDITARAAVAIELVHCYSLVHDDLPAMDDDSLRRGQPTVHVKFGPAMAILAGDALLTRAFGLLSELAPGEASALELVGELARAAGAAGMIAGQVADMNLCRVAPGVDGLKYIHSRKTGAMIRAACRMGAICGSANGLSLKAVGDFADLLGLTFQLMDDILDVTGSADKIGKTPGKDQAAGKRTYVTELGLEKARALADQLTAQASASLRPLGERAEKLTRLAELLARRTH